MSKILLITALVAFCALNAWPQVPLNRVKGLIIDKDSQQPLIHATVALVYTKDSSMAASALTDQKGTFLLGALKSGSYIVHITFLGYQSLMQSVEIAKTDTLLDLGAISMQRTGLYLKLVEIVRPRTAMIVKGDTLEFNAEFYKTRENAVVEELLKRLPGVKIEQDGTMTVNGQLVESILVNGKPFWGEVPTLDIRSLPADIIDKIQILDRKSDQDQLVGIERGKREKAINITIKEDRMGLFLGRFSAGYGVDKRFALGGNLSRFSEGEQLSVLGGANNVNNPGFLEGTGKGNRRAGLTHNRNISVYYSKDISNNLNIIGNYSFNNNDIEDVRNSARQNLLPDTTWFYNQDRYSIMSSVYHNLYTRIDYKVDTMYQFLLDISFYQHNTDNKQNNVYKSLDVRHQLVNSGETYAISDNHTPVFSTALSFGRKFRKIGRRVGAGLNINRDKTRQENINRSNNLFVQPNGQTFLDTINQYNTMSRHHREVLFTVVYTEPLYKDHFLDLAYVYSCHHTSSEKVTYDYDAAKMAYDRLNDSLSNAFINTYINHTPSIIFRSVKKKYDYTIGLYMLMSKLESSNVSRHSRFKQSLLKFYPTASFKYTFTNNNRFQAYYSGSPQQPDINQLQPVPDNSNPLYVQLGNPDLKIAFNHGLNLRYNASSPQTLRGFDANLNATLFADKIVNAIWFDSVGRQISQPKNVNGAFSINVNLVNTFRLKKLGTFINANSAFVFNQDVSYINGVRTNIRTFNITQGLGFNYVHDDLFDLGTNASIVYSGIRYAMQGENNANYFNYIFSVNVNLNLPLKLMIGVNLDYTINAGRTEGYNLNGAMSIAYIAKKLFKHERGLIKLQGFDLFNRNLSIARNIGEYYIEDVQSTVLKRFFMLSFSYYLKPTGNN